jgi:hypothetical protein
MYKNNDNFGILRCLINQGSVPGISTVGKTSLVTFLIGVVYRYWLVTPVLQYLSLRNWYLVAIVVAAATGCIMSLLKLPTLALVSASVAGLLLGGTWAAWHFPNDVPISVSGAFQSHLETFWRQILILTATVTIAGVCCTRFLRARTSSG